MNMLLLTTCFGKHFDAYSPAGHAGPHGFGTVLIPIRLPGTRATLLWHCFVTYPPAGPRGPPCFGTVSMPIRLPVLPVLPVLPILRAWQPGHE